MIRRALSNFLWWLDGLSAVQAVGCFILSGVPTVILFATVGRTTASATPTLVVFGLYTLHCIRRAHGGGQVWWCIVGPASLAGILRALFAPHGAGDAILSAAALLLSLVLAWAYDHGDADLDPPATTESYQRE